MQEYGTLIFMVLIFVFFYFFMVRPENKKKKQIEQMRNELAPGDEIVTIGGMVGKICHVDGNLVTFETGEDRVRIQIQKWGISSKVGFEPKEKGKEKDKEKK